MKKPKEKPPRNTRGHTFFEILHPPAPHGIPKDKKPTPHRKESDTPPNGFSPTEGGITAHRMLTEDGVAVLEWRAFFALPAKEDRPPGKSQRGAARIRAFYHGIAQEVCRFVEQELYPAEVRAYRAHPDPRKRFRYPRLILALDCREREKTDDWLLMVRRITLSRGGKRLWEAEEEELFSQKSGKMLPIKKPKKPPAHKKKGRECAACSSKSERKPASAPFS